MSTMHNKKRAGKGTLSSSSSECHAAGCSCSGPAINCSGVISSAFANALTTSGRETGRPLSARLIVVMAQPDLLASSRTVMNRLDLHSLNFIAYFRCCRDIGFSFKLIVTLVTILIRQLAKIKHLTLTLLANNSILLVCS